MYRKLHFRNGCKTASKHIGGYIEVTFAEFLKAAQENQCERCRTGRPFALNMKNYRE